jgi:hypothetical protein
MLATGFPSFHLKEAWSRLPVCFSSSTSKPAIELATRGFQRTSSDFPILSSSDLIPMHNPLKRRVILRSDRKLKI